VKKASGKAQNRSNSWLLREFATPQGVFSTAESALMN
jgi:hypothetical protein